MITARHLIEKLQQLDEHSQSIPGIPCIMSPDSRPLDIERIRKEALEDAKEQRILTVESISSRIDPEDL